MSILLLPHNIPESLKHLSTLVDDIWYYAGDRSTDVSASSVDLMLTVLWSLPVCTSVTLLPVTPQPSFSCV